MKRIAKPLLRIISLLVVCPAVLIFRLHAAVCGRDDAFPGWSQLFSLIPGRTGIYLRHAFYSYGLAKCGNEACISFGSLFSHPGASVGHGTYIGNYCSIGNVQIGDDVLIASHVSVMNGCHQHGISRLDVPVRDQPGTWEPITIGQDTWIGERATVAANIGRHCIVGAGALVLNPVPDYAVVVGVPAKIIHDRRELAESSTAADAMPL